ncbi:MAG TPA: hypothetical protein VF432_08905 [Thermoanaerobaculia bacterium]
MRGRWLLLLLAVLAVARLVSTYRVFSQTVDEPTHVVCGFEWLTTPGYSLDPEHPPLARILFGLGAAAEGARWRPELPRVDRGTDLLFRGEAYQRNLFVARLGNLPFFLLGLFAVWGWTRRLFGTEVALVAVALYSALPPILAHAGLATTDMAAAATVVFALYAFDVWLSGAPASSRPLRRLPAGRIPRESGRLEGGVAAGWKPALRLGLAIGLGLLSKFSFLLYFPAGALALLVARIGAPAAGRPVHRRLAGELLLIPLLAALLVWSGYKFSLGTLHAARLANLPPESLGYRAAKLASYPGYEWIRPDLLIRYYDYAHEAARRGVHGVDIVDWAKAAGYPSPQAGRAGDTLKNAPPLPPVPWVDRAREPFRRAWHRVVMRVPLPAPAFIAGAEYVAQHSSAGHPAFLLGRHRDQGWWYYFPIVLFFKTPLAFLALALAGTIALRRHPIAYVPLLMLLPALTSRINIGVRHVLPLYPVLAILAAYAAVALWRRSRPATVVLLGWFFVATAIAHPDYLPYFNELARRPEEIAVDSNFDWGQDLLRLEQLTRRERLQPLYLSYFGSADWRRLGIPAEDLPAHPVRGWVAVSEMQFRFGTPEQRGAFAWLEKRQPVRRVGKSIRLYRIE